MYKGPKDVKFYNPPNYLKQKVGSGGLPDKILDRAEKFIEKNNIDFSDYTKQLLDQIDAILLRVQKSKFRTRDHVVAVTIPVMQIKAHAGMFGHPLLSEVAASALTFLENIYILDNDAIDIIKAHQKVLIQISDNRVQGLGGSAGYALVKELMQVCSRYYKKHDIEPEN